MARSATERPDLLPTLADAFRAHGYEGTTIAVICKATGLGKGSLYHFFPGGKEEMAAAVLEEIDGWFERHIFGPLRDEENGAVAIAGMLESTAAYFRSGRRVCLIGSFALSDVRDRFAKRIRPYFEAWVNAVAQALRATGRHSRSEARELAEALVAEIQGALVLTRALDDPKIFEGTVRRARARLCKR